MDISDCQDLRSFSFEGFSNLVSLTNLGISMCKELFSSDVMPEHTLEDVIVTNYRAFPSLKSLTISSCGIAGKWLSLMLQHAPYLEKLSIDDCEHITTVLLPMEAGENSLSDIISAREDSSSGNQDETSTWLARDGLLHVPSDLISSLKEIFIWNCPRLTFNQGSECFSGFTSLERLMIWVCPELPSSLVHKEGSDDGENGRWLFPISLREFDISGYSQETLQPCFPRDSTSLTKLAVWSSPDLQYLQLHSCTALEELFINDCESLAAIEGLNSLGNLRHLTVYGLRQLSACLESFSRLSYRLCSQLETLKIDDPSVLTTSFSKHLTTLQRLQLTRLKKVRRLTNEQERALVLLKSLQELGFSYCFDLVVLPAGLHNLPSLKKLKMDACPRVSRLPETGLPLLLEELDIKFCSKKLADQCRLLETSKLKVKISLCS
ncbi:hypothetical protein CFC21_019024 [Triticum aestivum]|uniref:Uncharacterized protein n=2 Tax=Triticum aestivum TaxID=4565 RepID=A0A3B6B5T3_WHEAT|nr:hypothetical protein CFC21_019024 [Triticum aestivum]